METQKKTLKISLCSFGVGNHGSQVITNFLFYMYFSIFVANFNHYGLIQKTTTIGKSIERNLRRKNIALYGNAI